MSWCCRIKRKYIRLYELFTGMCGDGERQQTQWTEMLLIPFQTNMQKDVHNRKRKQKGCAKSYWKSDCNLLLTIQASLFLPLSYRCKLETMIAPWQCFNPEKQLFSKIKQFPLRQCLGYCPSPAPKLFVKLLSEFDASGGGIPWLRTASAGLSPALQNCFLTPPALSSAILGLAQLCSRLPAPCLQMSPGHPL